MFCCRDPDINFDALLIDFLFDVMLFATFGIMISLKVD